MHIKKQNMADDADGGDKNRRESVDSAGKRKLSLDFGKRRGSLSFARWFRRDREKIEENDVLVDQGIHYHQPQHPVEDQEGDMAGHRAVYVGVHMPLKHRHHRHHRHKHHKHKKNGLNESDSNQEIGPTTDTPLLKEEKPEQPQQRVKFILGDDGDEEHISHEVFTELEELTVGEDGEEQTWKEMARWIKYEEDVDVGADRWSKPHVATLHLHSLFELRSCLMNGTVCLDMEAEDLMQIADIVLDKLVASRQLEEEKRDQVREALLRKHRHHGQKKHREKRGSSILPMIRSLTDIGRSLSGTASNGSSLEQAAMQATGNTQCKSTPNFLNQHGSGSGSGSHLSVDSAEDVASGRKDSTASASNLHKVASATSMKARSNFMRKIPAGAEASNVLVGEVDFLSRPIIAFVRLAQSVLLEDLTEVPIPTRFLFIMLGPHTEEETRYHEIGRCIATLMSDSVFHGVAYKAKTVEDLLSGIDEFMDQVTVLPPGVWDPDIRIEPPKTEPPPTNRLANLQPANGHIEACDEENKHEGLEFTGRPFGGLIGDIRRRLPRYFSDFKDSLHLQCLASVFFMYFACITPVITFGGLLGEATNNLMATLEGLLGSAICGVGFALFSGQPLTILGSTGPILVYEKIIFGFCESNGLDYLAFRFWIGLWTSLMCMILVATDASAMVKYFTRFTEESFSSLISFIFIYEAIHKLIQIYEMNPVERYPYENNTYECDCVIGNSSKDWLNKEIETCELKNGTTVGNYCGQHEPQQDVFLMSVILMVGTFTIAFSLKKSRNTRYFPTIVRTTVSDFSVFVAVVIMIGVDMLFGVNTPKLDVPIYFEPTSKERTSWLVAPFGRKGENPWWTALAAFLPALLALILIFMDQQITSVIVNRKENKLKKGVGYHLDLMVVGLLLGLCSILGLPWFVAATVLSINHVSSLKVESECKAPGERPKVIGCREQRVTALVVFILIGLATLMTGILSLIPMPVLYGVFLFMGISSLAGVQLVDRLQLLFMPPKHQPDYIYLRQVGLRRVHFFTFIQLSGLIILWVIKSTVAALVFPIMVLALAFVRKLLDYIFTQRELEMLDDVMPEIVKRAKLDQREAAQGVQTTGDTIVGGRVQLPLAGGNVLTIPVDKVQFHPESGTINISEEMAKTGIWKTLACNAAEEGGNKKVHWQLGGKDETDAQKRMHDMPLKQEKFSPDTDKLPTIDDEEAAAIPYRQPSGSISGEISFPVPKFTIGGDSETPV